jgi:glycosyltransferase involved in cell wall biosynthesis
MLILLYIKDQTTLITTSAKVLANMATTRLVIVGEGLLKSQLEALIKKYPLESFVDMKGRVFEAHLFFVPVIGFNCSGVPDVRGEDGLLFPATGVRILAVELVQLYRTESTLGAAMSGALLDRLKTHFTYQAVREAFWSSPFKRTLWLR